jgi:predicted  nucleic acid-binding Zn-ribbon protein
LIKDSDEKMKRYETQQKNVRNNREFDALSKEIEFQELENQLADKRIKEFKSKIDAKKDIIAAAAGKLAERKSHLEFKKGELDNIMKETQEEEDILNKESLKQQKVIEDHLLHAYTRLRNSARNGLAVVAVQRGASGGSFFTIPPQRQLEIAARKKIITDEHSGRVLVDPDLAREEEEKMQKFFTSKN